MTTRTRAAADVTVEGLLARIDALDLEPEQRAALVKVARAEVAAVAKRERDAVYLADPPTWIDDRLQEFAWSKQREVMSALQSHRRVAVKSCHGVGKSHIASRTAAWWLDVHPPGEAFVVTTAPTFAQVRAILWRYIRQAHKRAEMLGSPMPGKVNQTEWQIDGELVAFGRKPSDTDESAFQGIHARYVLVILDEACGIPEQLWVAADALTTNNDCRILAIGNPDQPASHFRQVTVSDLWHTIRISAFDSPNFTDEVVPDSLRNLLISREWAEEKAVEWGVDNPLYISKVTGDFPADNPSAVVRFSDVSACRVPRDVPHEPSVLVPVALGVDVGGGGDETVIRERRGPLAGREWTERSDDSEKVTAAIMRAWKETGATLINIDSGGIGWGVVGQVRVALRNAGATGVHVNPVNAGSSASQPERFLNLRAEMWWAVGRELSESRGWDLSAMENADRTIAQLTEPRWDLSPKGTIRVEPKDDVIARLGRSPDNADALLLAFYAPRGQGHAFLEAWKQTAATGPGGPTVSPSDPGLPKTRENPH